MPSGVDVVEADQLRTEQRCEVTREGRLAGARASVDEHDGTRAGCSGAGGEGGRGRRSSDDEVPGSGGDRRDRRRRRDGGRRSAMSPNSGTAESRRPRPGAPHVTAEAAGLHRGGERAASADRQHEQREREPGQRGATDRGRATPRARRASSSARRSSANSPASRMPAKAPSTKRAGRCSTCARPSPKSVGSTVANSTTAGSPMASTRSSGRQPEPERPVGDLHEQPLDVDAARCAGRRARW